MFARAAGAVLLQARQVVRRRNSCEVSARSFATYAGGYAVWLLYGALADAGARAALVVGCAAAWTLVKGPASRCARSVFGHALGRGTAVRRAAG